MVETPSRLLVVEAKAGTTPSGAMLDSARRVADILGQDRGSAGAVSPLVAYGGDTPQQRSHGELLPWLALDKHDWLA